MKKKFGRCVDVFVSHQTTIPVPESITLWEYYIERYKNKRSIKKTNEKIDFDTFQMIYYFISCLIIVNDFKEGLCRID